MIQSLTTRCAALVTTWGGLTVGGIYDNTFVHFNHRFLLDSLLRRDTIIRKVNVVGEKEGYKSGTSASSCLLNLLGRVGVARLNEVAPLIANVASALD